MEAVVVGIVRYLVAFVAVLVAGVLAYAAARGLTWSEVATFALILLVAPVPVALPATYTLAGAVGALELSRRGCWSPGWRRSRTRRRSRWCAPTRPAP